MSAVDRLFEIISGEVSAYISEKRDLVREVRLRIGRPVQVVSDVDKLIGPPVSRELIRKVLLAATEFSLYSREDEIRRGYISLSDGCRMGVCGSLSQGENRLLEISDIGSISVRIAREIRGCAEVLLKHTIRENGQLMPVLIFSMPGMGKTTLLRDYSRLLSDMGYCVCIADERHEIAACVNGVPTMDVGRRTDVMDGMPKSDALIQMIRTMSPGILISDEIGTEADAEAVSEASRCGVIVVATAHAESFDELLNRNSIRKMIAGGVFSVVVKLGGKPGAVSEVRYCRPDGKGGVVWGSA